MRLFLAGDVMTGRGIDQILPNSCDPTIYESYCRSAKDYVALAEKAAGKIAIPVRYDYIWGDAMDEMDKRSTDLRIVNLETTITADGHPDSSKGIHYRMHPANVACLSAAKIDCCLLANNHAADWGYAGLVESISTLKKAKIAVVGVGNNAEEAATPSIHLLNNGTRVLVFGFGSPTAGVSSHWAATGQRAGVNYLPDLGEKTAKKVIAGITSHRLPSDLVVVSIHWGPNWGYEIPEEFRRFAHRLVDEAVVNAVHGHSSHHAIGCELYKGSLILYGCGDFITDYEGISGHEEYRSDIALAYFVDFSRSSDQPATRYECSRVEMVPFKSHKFSLRRALNVDAEWIARKLDSECKEKFGGKGVDLTSDGVLRLKI